MFHTFIHFFLFEFNTSNYRQQFHKLQAITVEEGNENCTVTDLVYSSCSWPGSGGKNFTASLNIVFAGPGKYGTVGHYHCYYH